MGIIPNHRQIQHSFCLLSSAVGRVGSGDGGVGDREEGWNDECHMVKSRVFHRSQGVYHIYGATGTICGCISVMKPLHIHVDYQCRI